MEDFFILGFIILVIIAWIINSNNEEKMNSMLDVHEAPTTSSLNSSISIANEDFRNFEDMQAATKIAESAYEKEVAKLENEYNELCEKSEAHLNSSSFISSIERDDSTDDLINKKISLKVFQERNAARSKAMTTISDNHFAEADKNLQIQIDKHQELLDHIGSRATYMNTIIANIISKETIVKADINTPSFNIENTKVDFNTFDKYFGPRNESGIAIDRVNKQIAFLTPNTRAIVRYADIVSSEVIVDSESIIKTDRVSQIGGAVVGGLLTGGLVRLLWQWVQAKNS